MHVKPWGWEEPLTESCTTDRTWLTLRRFRAVVLGQAKPAPKRYPRQLLVRLTWSQSGRLFHVLLCVVTGFVLGVVPLDLPRLDGLLFVY